MIDCIGGDTIMAAEFSKWPPKMHILLTVCSQQAYILFQTMQTYVFRGAESVRNAYGTTEMVISRVISHFAIQNGRHMNVNEDRYVNIIVSVGLI